MKLDNVFGVHENMLAYRSLRTQVLANNIANADTPNYKSKDLTFLNSYKELEQPHSLHSQLQYKIPYQKTLDGNTVEMHLEQAAFAKNTADYQASLMFLKLKISGLRTAIEGK